MLDRFTHYLPLGYLYLVILGIFRETITFYQLGINYLSYSSVMDVLLSPVAAITDHPLISGTVLVYMIFFYVFPKIVMKKANNKYRAALLGNKKLNRDMTDEEKRKEATKHFIIGAALGLLCFFLGFGWAQGQKTKERINDNTLKYKYKLSLNNGESKEVHLIELNSLYYFYVPKGSKNISISPVGSVNSLELIDNKMLK